MIQLSHGHIFLLLASQSETLCFAISPHCRILPHMSTASKLPQLGTSIFTLISQRAQEAGAINLSQGFPDFPVDPELLALYQAALARNTHQYTPMSGWPPLLEAIQHTIQQHYQRSLDTATELLVTAGATQGIFATLLALVPSGSEVVLLDPAYDCYDTPVRLSGAQPVHIPLQEDYAPDWTAIEAAVTPNTRLMVVNNPHNPSGYVWTAHDMAQLSALAHQHPQLLLLFDEVYEFICYEHPHLSAHRYPELYERAIVVSSFGKSLHVTGWKVGYVAAAACLMHEIKKVHQFMVFSVNSTAQHVLADYLNTHGLHSATPLYLPKREQFRQGLAHTAWQLLPCPGTYFQVADYSAYSDEPDTVFCERLIREAGVATIPISVFYEQAPPHRRVRFCFAKTEATLAEALQRLQQWHAAQF